MMTAGATFEKWFTRSDGCWDWTGYRDQAGYGRWAGGRYAHRVSYERHVGPIPDGLHIDHLCRNRACVNPAHLEAVPSQVNTLRGISVGAIATRTNRCMRDHEFTPENTYVRLDGQGRQCRACRRLRIAREKAISQGDE